MKTFETLLKQTLTISLAATLGVVPLVGCNNAQPTDNGGATTETTEANEQAIWVVTKETATYNDGENESQNVKTFELDDQGNAIKTTYDYPGTGATVETCEYDADGYITKQRLEGGEETTEITYTQEKDEQGRLIKLAGSNGSIEEYTYDADGNMIKSVMTMPYTYTDENGNSQDFTYRLETEYDANGLVTKSHVQSVGNRQVSEKTYELDDQGRPVSVTTRTWNEDENGAALGDYVDEKVVNVEYDENGNTLRTTEKTEYYTNVVEYEYTKVDAPSAGAVLKAHLTEF